MDLIKYSTWWRSQIWPLHWGRFPIAETENYFSYFVYFSDLKIIYSYFITIILIRNIIHWKSNEYESIIQNLNHFNSVLLTDGSVSRHQVLKGVLICKIDNKCTLVSCKNHSSVPFNLQLWSKMMRWKYWKVSNILTKFLRTLFYLKTSNFIYLVWAENELKLFLIFLKFLDILRNVWSNYLCQIILRIQIRHVTLYIWISAPFTALF